MRLGFIGIGKIATAVIEGLSTSKLQNSVINISPRNAEKSKLLVAKFPRINRQENNQQVLDESDMVFLALRPAECNNILQELNFRKNHTVVSFVPYLKFEELKSITEPAENVGRAIPLPTVTRHNCPIPLFNASENVKELFSHIGQPLTIESEDELHVLWTLTGLITPFYDQLDELSNWAISNKVDENIANQYIADLFQSLSFIAKESNPINFQELSGHAATPNGMNERSGIDIRNSGSHKAFKKALDNMLNNFK